MHLLKQILKEVIHKLNLKLHYLKLQSSHFLYLQNLNLILQKLDLFLRVHSLYKKLDYFSLDFLTYQYQTPSEYHFF